MTRFKQIADADAGVATVTVDDGVPMQSRTLASLEVFRNHLSLQLGFDVTTDQTVAWMLKQQGITTNDSTFTKHDGTVMPVPVNLTKADLMVIEGFAVKGEKIFAIKETRTRAKDPVTGTLMGLKDAKDFVEKHWYGNPNNVA